MSGAGAGFRRVDEAILAERNALADRIGAELGLAGLPWWRWDAPPDAGGGVIIEVDPGDDADGGVHLGWQVHADLAEQTSDALLAGRFDDPALTHAYRIEEHLLVALTAILSDAGFEVGPVEDDVRSLGLLVRDVPRPDRAGSGRLDPPLTSE